MHIRYTTSGNSEVVRVVMEMNVIYIKVEEENGI